jgi:hypothetical protein
MPAKPPTKAGPTKPRQFRFTDDEIAEIDEVARSMAEPGVPVTRMTVLRMAFRAFKANRASGKAR